MTSSRNKSYSHEGFSTGLVVDDDILFDDVYELREITSSENWSVTRKCIHRSTGQVCVVRIIELEQFNGTSNKDLESTIEDFKREASICHSLKHPYIVELFETYSNAGVFYMVYEFLSGVDLLHEIVSRALDGFVYSEAVACHYMRQILEAILYCHDNGIVHRNLQPSCVLLADTTNSAPIKLSGFSNAVHIPTLTSAITSGLYTNPHFTAPEILQGQPHGRNVDMWSAGVMLFVLLSGELPFCVTKDQLFCSIINGAFTMTSRAWSFISDRGKNLVSRMLENNPLERITVEEALMHPWLLNRNSVPRMHLQESIDGLKNLNSRRYLKENHYFEILSFDPSPLDHDATSWNNKDYPEVNSNQAINFAVSVLGEVENQVKTSRNDINFLSNVLQSKKLHSLLRLYDKIGSHTLDCCKPEQDNASKLLHDIADNLRLRMTTDIEKELHSIFVKPYFVGFLKAYDSTLREGYGDSTSSVVSSVPRTTSLNGEIDQQPNGNKTPNKNNNDFNSKVLQRIRMVQFQRNTAEPLGITLKIDTGGNCVVTRIMHGGMIHKQGTLSVGDIIKEINNACISGQSASELQEMLKNLRGSVSLKVVPGFKLNPVPCEIFVRAEFSYDPQKDDLIPCKSAGLPFNVADILQVTCKDDFNWWQARKINQGDAEPAGLIPSPELQEWRITCAALGKARREKGFNTWFNRRRKQQRENKYLVKRNAVFDALALLTYEEVVLLPCFKHKTLVLLGAHGVGRRHIKNTLIAEYADRFAYPVPHTTRAIGENETDGVDFHFTTHEEMMTDIANNEYLEYGAHEGAMYGTKLDTIKEIHGMNLQAILDVEIQALKILRTAEYAPFIVFIASPLIPENNDNPNLLKMKKESDHMQKSYKHYFDLVVVNSNMQNTIRTLVQALCDANKNPKWVPVSWVY